MSFFKRPKPAPAPATSEWVRLISRDGRNLGIEFTCKTCATRYHIPPDTAPVVSHCGKSEALQVDPATLPKKKSGLTFLDGSGSFAFDRDADADYEKDKDVPWL